MGTLRLILGDQLSASIATLRDIDRQAYRNLYNKPKPEIDAIVEQAERFLEIMD